MKVKLYVRVAKHNRFRDDKRVEASMTYNPEPLFVGSGAYGREAVHTAFFSLTMDVPDELLRPADLPNVDMGLLDVERATTVTPVVEQEDAPEVSDVI